MSIRTIGRNPHRWISWVSHSNDSLYISCLGDSYGSKTNSISNKSISIFVVNIRCCNNWVFIIFGILSFFDDFSHIFHYLHRIFSNGSFPRKHYSIGTIKYWVGNIIYLCTSWSKAINHCLHHLSSNNDRFSL